MGRYCSYLLPKQTGGITQILIFKTLRMIGRPAVYLRRFAFIRPQGSKAKTPAVLVDIVTPVVDPGALEPCRRLHANRSSNSVISHNVHSSSSSGLTVPSRSRSFNFPIFNSTLKCQMIELTCFRFGSGFLVLVVSQWQSLTLMS